MPDYDPMSFEFGVQKSIGQWVVAWCAKF
jgi:hypothetical protein